MFSHSSQAVLESRLEQAQVQAQGARLLSAIAEVLLDLSVPPEAVRQEIFRRIPREQVSAALEQASALENSEAEALFQELRQRYSYVRSPGAAHPQLRFTAGRE